MTVEWLYNEESNTIGHVAKLKLDGITSISPQHAQTIQDVEAIEIAGVKKNLDSVAISGEPINYSAFQGTGKPTIVNPLQKR